MIIQHEESGHKGAFFIKENGHRLAEMTYSKAGESILIIDHTEVAEELRGTHTGRALVMQAAEYARAQNLKIIPLCPFAKSVFDKTPALSDVLK